MFSFDRDKRQKTDRPDRDGAPLNSTPLNSASPTRRSGPWGRQALLNAGLVCLAAGAVGGKQLLLHSSLRAFSTGPGGCIQITPPVANLALTDIYLLGTGTGQGVLRVEWDGNSTATQFVNGGTPGASTLTNNNGHYTLIDTFVPQVGAGARRVYSVQQQDPPATPPPPYAGCDRPLSPAVTINATPVQAAVSGNQSVDARYDPRYALWTHLNHNFGATTYRGGLYAGYNGDNSQVGHAYLNFAPPPVPQGQSVWPNVGSVNAYYLRSYTPGSTSIGCRSVPSAWASTTLTWSTAPAPITGGVTPAATVSYDSQQPVPQPITGWTHWNMSGEIPSAVPGGAYAAFLYGTSEPSTATDPIGGAATGWAYFSKKEYAQGQPACILYAYSN